MIARLLLAGLAAFAVTSAALAWTRRLPHVHAAPKPVTFNGAPALSSERGAIPRFPDEGDCPGRDLEGVVRPPGWRRLFCIDSENALLLCYAAPEPPERALAAFTGNLEKAGWTRTPAPGVPDACYRRGGARCLVGAEPAGEGSQVSVTRILSHMVDSAALRK